MDKYYYCNYVFPPKKTVISHWRKIHLEKCNGVSIFDTEILHSLYFEIHFAHSIHVLNGEKMKKSLKKGLLSKVFLSLW